VEFGFTAVVGGETVDRSDATAVVLSGGLPYGEEFERRMLGVEPGRPAPSRSPTPDFRNPKYAGKTVTFEVKVGGVREKKLPRWTTRS